MFENFHDRKDSQWQESSYKSTEPESWQIAKINFLPSDELAQNYVNLSRGFHTKQQLFTLSGTQSHCFFITLKSHKMCVTTHSCNYFRNTVHVPGMKCTNVMKTDF